MTVAVSLAPSDAAESGTAVVTRSGAAVALYDASGTPLGTNEVAISAGVIAFRVDPGPVSVRYPNRNGSGYSSRSVNAVEAPSGTAPFGASDAITNEGLLAAMPATGTGSKALYYATDGGLYADLTDGGAYTKVSDLPGVGNKRLFFAKVDGQIDLTSTVVASLPSPGPLTTGALIIPAGIAGVRVTVEIPNVSHSNAGQNVQALLYEDGALVKGTLRAFDVNTNVFPAGFKYETALSPGSHVYEVKYNVSGGTAHFLSYPGGPSCSLAVDSIAP